MTSMIVLTGGRQLMENKSANIYSKSKCAFEVIYKFRIIRKQRCLYTWKPLYKLDIKELLDALLLPKKIAIIQIKGQRQRPIIWQ